MEFMPYKLKVRNITEFDVSVDCPFIPDQDEFEMYITAFKEDIATLEFVTNITQNGSFLIITLEEQSEAVLHQLNIEVRRLIKTIYSDKLRVEGPFEKF
jgi:hypothetical protein